MGTFYRSLTLAGVVFAAAYAKGQDIAPAINESGANSEITLNQNSNGFLRLNDEFPKKVLEPADEMQLAYVGKDAVKNSLSTLDSTSDLVIKLDSTPDKPEREDLRVYRLADTVVYADKETRRDWFSWAKKSGGAVEGIGFELFKGWESHIDKSNFHIDDYRYETDEYYREEVDRDIKNRLKRGMKDYLKGVRKNALNNLEWYDNKKDKAKHVERKHFTLSYDGQTDRDFNIEAKPVFRGGSAGFILDVNNFYGGTIESGAFVSAEDAFFGDTDESVQAEIKYVREIDRLPILGNKSRGARLEVGGEADLGDQKIGVGLVFSW